jgi:hypothetical protein
VSMGRKHKFLVVGCSLLALLVAVLWWLVVGPESPPRALEEPPVVQEPAPAPAAPVGPAAQDLQSPDDRGAGGSVPVGDPLHTTVAWPVKLRLELVDPAGLAKAPGVASLGSSASARLAGSVLGPEGTGLPARVRFAAGPNEGRLLTTNSAGKFGAADLYPGLSVVEVDGPGDYDVRREVRLRSGAETSLNLGFGMPGAASGRVLDRDGKPVESAAVELDGQLQYSAADGSFLFSNVASGYDVVCTVSKPGFAAHFELVTIAARQTNDRLVFTLLPAAALDVEIPERLGSPGEAMVVLMNANAAAQRRFPWRTVSPFKLQPGSRAHLEGLPAGTRVRVYVFHAGALARPSYAEVNLEEGQTQLAVVHLDPAPVVVGTVRTQDGLVAPGARVRLEAPDRVGSTLAYFEETALFLETEVLPSFPMGLQEAVADHNGRFEFTAYAKQAPRRYVVATSADGAETGSVIIGPEDQVVNLVLAPRRASGSLKVEFPGRHQALEVECTVRGEPRDRIVLPAGEAYELVDLPGGTWRLTATWRGQEIPVSDTVGRGFLVEGSTTQVVRLPQGAIDGQDEDTLLRAGRRP